MPLYKVLWPSALLMALITMTFVLADEFDIAGSFGLATIAIFGVATISTLFETRHPDA